MADQRISEDVKKTAEGFAQIFQEVLYGGTAGVYYSVMLYSHYGLFITVAPWAYLILAQVRHYARPAIATAGFDAFPG